MQLTFAENDGNDCSVGLPANQLTIRTCNVLQMLIAVTGKYKTNSHKKTGPSTALMNRINE
jgi:hypothetical protein